MGNNNYNGLSVRLEHRFGNGLYFLNSFTTGNALGDSEQALEYYAGGYAANPQNIHNLKAEHGPPSFNVRYSNVTSVVYQLPFGKGRKWASSVNGWEDAAIGGWEINTINTAHTGTPLNVFYVPSTANDVTGLSNDYRGQAFERPNVTGGPVAQSTLGMINNYFAGYTFTTAPGERPLRESGTQRLQHSRLRAVGLRRGQDLSNSRGRPYAVPVGVLQFPESDKFWGSRHEND